MMWGFVFLILTAIKCVNDVIVGGCASASFFVTTTGGSVAPVCDEEHFVAAKRFYSFFDEIN